MLVVSRPAMAMATSGSPVTALAYHIEVKPSASACLACRTTLSTVALAAGQTDPHLSTSRTQRRSITCPSPV